jgi:succinate dehydrogenase/fumarate reductase-like Fe-S protein
MLDENKTVNMKIFRFDPSTDEAPRYETYQVKTCTGFSVLNGLQYIAEHIDTTLSFYVSCRIGVCLGCLVKINGRPERTCSAMLTDDVLLEPLDAKNVLKDLLVKPLKRNS